MDRNILEHRVRVAIDVLTNLQADGFKIEDESELAWKNRFFELKSIIDSHLIESAELLEDMRSNGLTIATADAEGAWRGAKYMANCASDLAEEI